MPKRRAIVMLPAASVSPLPALAQPAWQAATGQDITLVVAFSPGGSTDVAARLLSRKLSELGLRTIVANRSGGSGVEGIGFVARQPPNGATLLGGGSAATLFLPARQNTGWARADFEPIALWSSSLFAFAVRTESPIATMGDLLRVAAERRGGLSLGSTGSGGEYQFLIERVFGEAGASVNYVGYRGGADVATAVAGGHVDAGYMSMASSAQLAREGRLRYLAHTSEIAERVRPFPDVPHVAAFGSRQAQIAFNALMGPRGVPAPFRDAIAAAIRAATEDPAFVTAHENLGMIVDYKGPDAFRAYIEHIEQTFIPVYRDWRPA